MLIQRRTLLLGIGASLVPSPAIVRFSSLMPVRALTFGRVGNWSDLINVGGCVGKCSALSSTGIFVSGVYHYYDGDGKQPWAIRYSREEFMS